jgi:hypothetical protein
MAETRVRIPVAVLLTPRKHGAFRVLGTGARQFVRQSGSDERRRVPSASRGPCACGTGSHRRDVCHRRDRGVHRGGHQFDLLQPDGHWHPDAIVRPAAGWPEPGPFVGREAVMQSFEQLRDAWGQADTLETTGDILDIADRVIVRIVWRAVGHGPDWRCT